MKQKIIDVLKTTSLNSERLKIYGDGKNRQRVADSAHPDGVREGQFFISLPTDLSGVLPGSVCLPSEFFQGLTPAMNLDYSHQRLISDSLGDENNPVFNLIVDGFALQVFHGCLNHHALEISRLAAKGFTDSQVRGQYQTHLFQIMRAVISKPSGFNLRIVEDCLASGDTLVGVISLFHHLGKVSPQSRIRIDVAVATAQGILVLQKFAKDNHLPLEFNVGYLAYGLSEGESIGGVEKVRAHANYIVYPGQILEQLPESVRGRLESCQAADGNIYVVGDMGDASQRTEGVSWDHLRTDSWGVSGNQKAATQQSFNPSKPTAVYLTNGGYLMKAFLDYLQQDKEVNQLVFSAKRVWSSDPKFGYGVLIDNLPNKGITSY